jgi:hypothetical protein
MLCTKCSLSNTTLQWSYMLAAMQLKLMNTNVWHFRSSAVVREAHSPVQRTRTRSRAKVFNPHDMAFAWYNCGSSYVHLPVLAIWCRQLQQVSHQFFTWKMMSPLLLQELQTSMPFFPSFHYAIIIMIQLLIAPKYVWIFIFHSSKYLPVLWKYGIPETSKCLFPTKTPKQGHNLR